jgi:peroxiredoxin
MSTRPLVELMEETVLRCRDMDIPLNEKLTIVFDQVQALNPEFAKAVERLIGRLKQGGAAEGAPEVGDPMPSFMLPDETGTLVQLEDLLANGPVAIVFNRGHWCPYCRLNTVALARAYDQARGAGGQIVAITPERQQYSKKLKAWASAPFPVLTDMDNAYAMSLGLAFHVGGELDRYTRVGGVDLATYHNNETWMLPVPATFVVAPDGTIAARFVEPDYRRRMEIDDLLAGLREAGQFR